MIDTTITVETSSRTHPARIVKCTKCGITFIAFHKRELCDTCRKAMRVEYQKEYSQKRYAKRRQAQPEAIRRGRPPKKKNMKKELKRCKYCGTYSSGEFCKACMTEGWDSVYAFTGRSNGWDKQEKVKVKIVSGWRGSQGGIIGGFAPSSRVPY